MKESSTKASRMVLKSGDEERDVEIVDELYVDVSAADRYEEVRITRTFTTYWLLTVNPFDADPLQH